MVSLPKSVFLAIALRTLVARDALSFVVKHQSSFFVDRVVAQGAMDARPVDLGGDEVHAGLGMGAATVDVGLLAALDPRHNFSDDGITVEDRQRVSQETLLTGAGAVADGQVILALDLAGQPF